LRLRELPPRPFRLSQGGVLNIIMEFADSGDVAAAIQRRQKDKKFFSEDDVMLMWVML
jgi:NIMA (never in mitosis gene a)-related kinase